MVFMNKENLTLKDFILEKDGKGASALIHSELFDLDIWYDIWGIDKENGYELDFNQYIFYLDDTRDLEQQRLQKHLLNYTEYVMQLVDDKLYELGVF